jgi:hypothetical protein
MRIPQCLSHCQSQSEKNQSHLPVKEDSEPLTICYEIQDGDEKTKNVYIIAFSTATYLRKQVMFGTMYY